MEQTFKVYHEKYMGSGYQEIRAHNHEDAALEYAEVYNTDSDNALINGEPSEIEVESESGDRRRYRLHAEPSVEYFADSL